MPLSHTNWGPDEPNDHEGREECVEMVSNNNGTASWWNDINCDAHQDWICMISKGTTPVVPPVPPSPVPGIYRSIRSFQVVYQSTGFFYVYVHIGRIYYR